MAATADKYVIPYTSEMRREADGGYNECTDASTVMLGAAWTLGEILENPDGSRKNPNMFRNTLRGKAGFSEAGGLTLHDANDMLQVIDPDLPPLLRYNDQRLRPGQSSEGARLRVTFEELRTMLRNGYVVMLCGNPVGVRDPDSPFRTKARNDRYPHVVVLYRGTENGATLLDPLTTQGPAWKGEKVPWDAIRQFTEAKDPSGDRYFGSASEVAAAVARIGSETQAAREERARFTAAAKLNERLAEQKDQTRLALDERDAARHELKGARARIAELEQTPGQDCTAAVNAERKRILDELDEWTASHR